jgi:uncharacterized iron-regulated protein
MQNVALILALATGIGGLAADAPAYRVFRADGTAASLEDAVAEAGQATVTFLGESHDDPTAHVIEFEFLKLLHANGPLVLTLEMFERDVQYVLDEYLDSQIGEDHLIASGRAWRHYKTDYRPLIEFAKANKIPVVAGNAPRRYVNRAGLHGQKSFDVLSAAAKATLPPLPYAEASERYAKKFHDIMEKMRREAEERAKAENKPQAQPARKRDPAKALEAQSLWDASMAYSISDALMRHPGSRILQVNGSFHSEDRLGILDHLERYRPATKSVVITMLSHKSYPNWNEELTGKGDFVIVTDPSLPRSGK